MIGLEGRYIAGLDEFMLRLGHLNVLAPISGSGSGSRTHVARRFVSALIEPTVVTDVEQHSVAEYLLTKKICAVRDVDGNLTPAPRRARYHDVEVVLDESGTPLHVVSTKGKAVEVWYQDWALAHPEVASRVGAVTVSVERSGHKSGVSHLVDWARLIGITNTRLGLSFEGRAATFLRSRAEGASHSNPYVLGAERVVYAWLLFTTDFDALMRVLVVLCDVGEVSKGGAIDLMHEVGKGIVAGALREATTRAARAARSVQGDLGMARGKVPANSTVWHRVSSRLESLVDLGLLTKIAASGSDRRYEYYYRITDAGRDLASRAQRGNIPVVEFLEHNLVESLAIGLQPNPEAEAQACFEAALTLSQVTGLHLDSYSVAASGRALQLGAKLGIIEARRRITAVAIRTPDVARLSRGAYGDRAEFASVSLRKLEAGGPGLFYDTDKGET